MTKMAAPMEKENVELGFVEKTDAFLLRSRFFPSKLGGRPAWLSLNPLPTAEQLACRVCSRPTTFLMQVYSPVTDKEDCFHRTVFVFVCNNSDCCKANVADNFHVFRSQLPRVHYFYSADPPEEKPVENEVNASNFNKICRVCGCLGPKTCAKCRNIDYCSREHQTIDWKKYHKQECTAKQEDISLDKPYDCLFPELELITETENVLTEAENGEKSDAEKMKEYKEFVKSEKGSEMLGSLSESELQNMASKESDNDKQLRKFKKRISFEPEQVLRYQRGGEPLWIANSPKPDAVPDCQCGAKRQFEFQVLPHMLSYMNVDKLGASLDWGTLCVYTCSESCATGNQYKREYIFKQDVV